MSVRLEVDQQSPQLDKKIFDSNRSSSSSGLSSEDDEEYVNAQNSANRLYIKANKMGSNNSERYMSLPVREKHENFLKQVVNVILNQAVFDGTKRENKVNEWICPEDLLKTMNFALKDEPDSDEQMLKLAQDTIKYSVKTGHPYFINQLFSSLDPYGLAGQFITDALNPRYAREFDFPFLWILI